jgi:hypothetical protein
MAITQRLVDPSREFKVAVRYSWQDSYWAVLLETDWKKMVSLVRKAESELQKRLLELSQEKATQAERAAVINALNGLSNLRMDAASWLERQKTANPEILSSENDEASLPEN